MVPMWQIRKYYKPGNVIYCGYWRSYDKVIAFHNNHHSTWTVTVAQCDHCGILIGPQRTHCTEPSFRLGDRIVIPA
jgi:hypothetical protein